ncbi:flippase [Candidatus Fermentibacterales bacterium]|nr:flippase [Candidatus Fermentibacterales bacterium]
MANSLSMLTGQLAAKLAQLVALMLLSRYLLDAGFGMLTFGLSVSMILFFLLDMGVALVINRKLSVDPGRTQEVFSTALGLRFALTAAGFSLLAALSLIAYSRQQALMILIVGAGAALDSWGELIFAVFRSRERMGLEAISRSVGALASLATVVLVIRSGLGPLAAASAYATRGALIFLVAALLAGLRFRIRLRPGFARAHLARLLRESWPLGAMGLLFVALQRADMIILERLRGVEAVGAYTESFRILETLVLVVTPTLLPGALFPSLCRSFEAGWASFSEKMEGIAGLVTGLSLLVMVPLLSGGLPVLEAIWGASFVRGQPLSQVSATFTILMAATPVFFWMNFLLASVIAVGRQRVTVRVAGLALLLSICGNLLLVPRIGMTGSAVMATLSGALMGGLFLLHLGRMGPLPLLRGSWRPLVAGVASGATALVLRDSPCVAIRVILPAASFLVVWIPLGGLDPLTRPAGAGEED